MRQRWFVNAKNSGVEMHGGAVRLESDGQNRGSTVSFVWLLLKNEGEYLS
jgi:hypothetical protein